MVKEYFEVHSNNMDQNQHGPPAQEAHGKNQCQSNPMLELTTNPPTQNVGPSVPSSYPREQQHAPQYMYQPQQGHLQQQLNNFWTKQCQEIEESTDFRAHSLPLARIKKIMKADEHVRMISAEAPVVFAKACEMFILELTMRAWANTEENKRRTIQKGDIESSITRSDVFDFLVDIVPRDETVDHEVLVGLPRRGNATAAPTQNVPYYYMPPHQHAAGPPRMAMGRPVLDQNHHGLQTHPGPTPVWPNNPSQQNDSPNSDE